MVDALTSIRSVFDPPETLRRLKAAIEAKGMTLFAHVDHAAGARAAGLPLRPTDLLIFGAARGGTPLMQAAQTMGIDLPLKALVWRDAEGTVWLSYDDPEGLAKRHGVDAAPARPLAQALAALAAAATSP